MIRIASLPSLALPDRADDQQHPPGEGTSESLEARLSDGLFAVLPVETVRVNEHGHRLFKRNVVLLKVRLTTLQLAGARSGQELTIRRG